MQLILHYITTQTMPLVNMLCNYYFVVLDFRIFFVVQSCRFKGKSLSSSRKLEVTVFEPQILMTDEIERTDSWDRAEMERDIRQGIDLATTLERIEKNFVITDPRLPDNPIVRPISPTV